MDKIIKCLRSDNDIRTVVLTTGMAGITVVFAVYNGVFGIRYSSLWHGSICVYYLLLSVIRVFILLSERHIQKQNGDKEQSRRTVFVIANLILILINLSMILPAALMVTFEKPVRMTLIPAIFMAVYTTIKVFLAVLQLKHRASTANMLIRELWIINLVDAALSVISLQNTLIMAVGNSADESLFLLSAVTSGIIIVGTIIVEACYFVKEMKP